MKLYRYCFIILFVSHPAYSESAKGYLDISVYLSGFDSDRDFVLNEMIPVFKDSEAEAVDGYLKLEGSGHWISIHDGEFNGKPLRTNGDEYWPLYSASSIRFYEFKNDLARVFANQIDGGVWIRLKYQFDKDGRSAKVSLRPHIWTANIGYPDTWGRRGYEPWRTSGYEGFHLREEPNFESKIVIELDQRWHIIKYGTGRVDGKWAEVVVEEILGGLEGCYTFQELEPYLTGKVTTGWLKVLSESGEPNIFTDGIC